ncbi:MAG: tryptophan synthase subunit alpha [Kiritimatiellaceae bacterium]|jgi:tryptophan synthase alpha chain|nr:MAG: tryptophan synthase subunit alpha [Kiritimatiellaceae bacterium]
MRARLDRCFKALSKTEKKAFIAYLSAGDPDLESTVDIVLRLEDQGVDVIELGLPFSDPLADGRVNQEASTRALEAGSTFEGVMDCVASIRKRSDIPIVFYAYMNPLLSRGFDKAIREGAEAGADGFLLLDLPVEESRPYRASLKAQNVHAIQLITPTTPDERMGKIVKQASGFVYCVSREGVTGVQDRIAAGAGELVQRIKAHTSLPVAIGFGIGTPEQAGEAAQLADGVVVGSAIVKAFHEESHDAAGRARAAAFVGSLVRAVKEV